MSSCVPSDNAKLRALRWAKHFCDTEKPEASFFQNINKVQALGLLLIVLGVGILVGAGCIFFKPVLPLEQWQISLISGGGVILSLSLLILGIKFVQKNQFSLIEENLPLLIERGLKEFVKHTHFCREVITKAQILEIISKCETTDDVYKFLGVHGVDEATWTSAQSGPKRYLPIASLNEAPLVSDPKVHEPVVDPNNPWGFTIREIANILFPLYVKEIATLIPEASQALDKPLIFLRPLEVFSSRAEALLRECPQLRDSIRKMYQKMDGQSQSLFNTNMLARYGVEPAKLPPVVI